MHVPKVMQHERQHHFHVEDMAGELSNWDAPSGDMATDCSQEVVDVPVEQHVEQVVHVPVVLGLVHVLLQNW